MRLTDEFDRSQQIASLGNDCPGPSRHATFDRLGESEFALTRSLREGVRPLADRFASDDQFAVNPSN